MQSRVLAILIAVVLALVATAALVVYVNGADRRRSAAGAGSGLGGQEAHQAGTSALTPRTPSSSTRSVPRRNVAKGVVVSLSQIQNKVAAVDIVPGSSSC